MIAGPLPGVAEIAGRDTLITTRWLHPRMHELIPALPTHIIGTYYGPPAPRAWTVGKTRLAGTGRAGGIGVVPAGWWGHWDIEAEASLSYVMLSEARLHDFAEEHLSRARRVELLPRVAEPDPIGAQLLRSLSRHAVRPDPAGGLHVEQALDLLCMHLVKVHSSAGRLPAPIARRGLLPWQVRRVTTYMRDRLGEHIGLDDLARQLNLSRYHFCAAFRLATGRTPHDWLTSLRMSRARELLSDPDLHVTDIALEVGYRTPSAFAASFRKVVGVTPSEFRRSL